MVTFQSWDAKIIERLPVDLALEFPAQLSPWSGITLSTFHFMPSCFQNGMGAKQFSDSLRVQHLHKYDDFIEKHEMDFNQHTAMLSGDICALDHSLKVNLTSCLTILQFLTFF